MKSKKVCIVGYGSIGKRHHSVMKRVLGSESEFTIIDVNTKTSISQEKDKYFDILVVCTPSSSHLEVASNFNNIGELIFIEKPIDSNLKNIDSYRDQIDIEKVHIGSNLRYSDPVVSLRKIADSVKFANVVSASYLPNWRPGNHLESYSANSALGGGVLLDFIHEPDYISSIFGMPEHSKIVQKRLFGNITRDVPDTAFMLWEYSDKIINFSLSYGSKEFKRNVEVVLQSGETKNFPITREDINQSYFKQWNHILTFGPDNSYDHAGKLTKILLNEDA